MSNIPNEQPTAPSLKTAWAVYCQRSVLRLFFLGFSSGLPFLLVFGTLSFWLREAQINRVTIGMTAWIALAYSFKWVWAPFVDRIPIAGLTHRLGRRRSWLLVAQVLVVVGLLGMATSNPQQALAPLVGYALLVAFASATQDIALDAFRIESAASVHQAALAASYQMGYRLAMIWSSAGALWIASLVSPQGYQVHAWGVTYSVMAASMLVGIISTLWVSEPKRVLIVNPPDWKSWIQKVVVEPFKAFFHNHGRLAVVMLALIAIYRISDIVMGVMANPFYVDMGYTKAEIAEIAKVYGLIMTLLGGFIGGFLSMRFGVLRVLMLGAILSAASNLLFAWLSTRGHDVRALIGVIAIDNLSSGLASAAFVAYLSSLTQVTYSASQYAMLSSLMTLIPKTLSGYSGWFVTQWGYGPFFVMTAALGIPVLLLIAYLMKK